MPHLPNMSEERNMLNINLWTDTTVLDNSRVLKGTVVSVQHTCVLIFIFYLLNNKKLFYDSIFRKLLIERLNNDGQQVHQYQQNIKVHLTLDH